MQAKSYQVESAVLEVIDLLCGDQSEKKVDNDLQKRYSNTDFNFDSAESDGLNFYLCVFAPSEINRIF